MVFLASGVWGGADDGVGGGGYNSDSLNPDTLLTGDTPPIYAHVHVNNHQHQAPRLTGIPPLGT